MPAKKVSRYSKRKHPAYTAEDRERAFLYWVENASLNKTAQEMGVSYGTIVNWKKQGHWDLRAEKHVHEIQEDFVLVDSVIEKVADDLGLRPVDLDTFSNIKKVEELLMKKALGKEINNVELRDLSYRDCISALKKCWDSKAAIVSRVTAPKKEANITNVGVSLNLTDLVSQISEKKTIDVQAKQIGEKDTEKSNTT